MQGHLLIHAKNISYIYHFHHHDPAKDHGCQYEVASQASIYPLYFLKKYTQNLKRRKYMTYKGESINRS
jgi:hypothetical protein